MYFVMVSEKSLRPVNIVGEAKNAAVSPRVVLVRAFVKWYFTTVLIGALGSGGPVFSLKIQCPAVKQAQARAHLSGLEQLLPGNWTFIPSVAPYNLFS